MNSSILKIAGEDALQQNIVETKEYVNARTGVWTTPVSGLVGDTSVTINNAAIKPTSHIDRVSAHTANGAAIGFTKIAITTGQAVVTFSKALTQAASVALHIINSEDDTSFIPMGFDESQSVAQSLINNQCLKKTVVRVREKTADYDTGVSATDVYLVAVEGWSGYDEGGVAVYLTYVPFSQTSPNPNALNKTALWEFDNTGGGGNYFKNNFELFKGTNGNFHIKTNKVGGNYLSVRATFYRLTYGG